MTEEPMCCNAEIIADGIADDARCQSRKESGVILQRICNRRNKRGRANRRNRCDYHCIEIDFKDFAKKSMKNHASEN